MPRFDSSQALTYIGGMTTTGQAARARATEHAAHTYITHVTEARTTELAAGIARQVRPTVLLAMADILHIDAEGHGPAWVRNAIVKEARA